MKEVGHERAMANHSDDITEGEMADYMAAELSGDYSVTCTRSHA